MALSLVSQQQGQYSNDSAPMGSAISVLVGDVVLMFVSQSYGNTFINALVHGTSTATATVSTLSSGVNASTGNVVAMFVVTGAGDLVVAPNFDTARDCTYILSQWRGSVASGPIYGSVVAANGSGTTWTGTATSAEKAGDVIVSFAAGGNINFPTITETSGWTLINKRDGASAYWPSLIAEYRVATDTSPVTSAPVSTVTASYRNVTLVLSEAPEVIPGTIVARGLYL